MYILFIYKYNDYIKTNIYMEELKKQVEELITINMKREFTNGDNVIEYHIESIKLNNSRNKWNIAFIFNHIKLNVIPSIQYTVSMPYDISHISPQLFTNVRKQISSRFLELYRIHLIYSILSNVHGVTKPELEDTNTDELLYILKIVSNKNTSDIKLLLN